MLPPLLFSEVYTTKNCQDTYCNQGQAIVNYSTSDNIIVYTWPINIPANVIIISWSGLGIPIDAVIDSAFVELYMSGTDGSGMDAIYDVSVHEMYEIGLDVAQCTWNTYDGVNPWSGGSIYGTSVIKSAESHSFISTAIGYKKWNVTQMVSDWQSINTLDMMFKPNSQSSDANRIFHSSEYTDSTKVPMLTVYYTTDGDTTLPSSPELRTHLSRAKFLWDQVWHPDMRGFEFRCIETSTQEEYPVNLVDTTYAGTSYSCQLIVNYIPGTNNLWEYNREYTIDGRAVAEGAYDPLYSEWCEPATGYFMHGDFNTDWAIDGLDLIIFSGKFGIVVVNLYEDLNQDGVIDGLDLIIFAKQFGKSWSP